ncbi:MAG: EamA family transporter, partial [Burkholderiaceae bacterium]
MSPIGTRFGLPPKAAPERAFRRSGSNGGWPLASGMPAAYRNGGLGVFVFGFSLAFTRLAVRELDPTFVAVTRAALAGLAAATYLALVKASPPKAYQVRPLIEVSLCVIFGFPLLSSYAMHDLRATQGAIFNGVMPLLTALFGCIIAKERPSLSFWLCAVAGAGLVGASAWQTGTAEARSGDFAMAAAVLFASFGYARGATLARTMGGPCVISWALVISLPITLTLSLWEGQRHWGQLLDASWGAWVGLAY